MRFYIYLLALTLIISSCYKDEDNQEIIIVTEVPTTTANGDLNGKVIDQSGEILSDYTLVLGEQNYRVSKPYFNIKNVNIRKEGQMINVLSDGQLIATKYVYLLENDYNKLDINTFSSNVNKQIAHNYKGNIGLTSDIILDLTDAAITSSSSLVLTSFEITPENITESFGVSAYSNSGELYVLRPELGFGFELWEGSSVKPLGAEGVMRLDFDGHEGKGLFTFDHSLGYWKWVGDIGNRPMEVLNAGYYMVSDYEAGTYIEGKTTTQEVPISYLKAVLAYSDHQFYNTELGRWAGVFPLVAANGEVIFTDPCDTPILTHEFENANNGTEIKVNIDSHAKLFQLETTLLDCNGESLNTQAINVTIEDHDNLFVFNNEKVNTWLTLCNEEATVAAYDIETSYNADGIPWSNQLEGNLGYLTACEDFENGFSFININGEQQVFEAFDFKYENNKTILSSKENDFRLSFRGEMIGSYETQDVNIYIDKEDFGNEGYYISCEQSDRGCGINDFDVTHFMTMSNGWIRASFNGRLWMQTIMDPTAGYYDIEGVIIIKT